MLKFTDDHEWLLIEDGTATVGITTHATEQLGDIVFIELPELDTEHMKGDAVAVVESVKAASDVYMPLDGTVVAVNDAIVETPATVNDDPMSGGWFFKIKLSDPTDAEELMDEDAYKAITT